MANTPGIQFPNVPAPPDSTEDPREEAKRNLFMRALNDPRVMQFLLSMGANLSQPRRLGQSELQGFSESVLSGFQGVELSRAAQVERERLEREERREAIAASNAAVVAQSDLKSAETRRGLTGVQTENARAKGVEFVETRERRDRAAEAGISSVKQGTATNKAEEDLARKRLELIPGELENQQLTIENTRMTRQNLAVSLENERERMNLTHQEFNARMNFERLRLEQLKLTAILKNDPTLKQAAEDMDLVGRALTQGLPSFTGTETPEKRENTTNIVLNRVSQLGDERKVAGLNRFIKNGDTNLDTLSAIIGKFRETGQRENGKMVVEAVTPITGGGIILENSPNFTTVKFPSKDDPSGFVTFLRIESADHVAYIRVPSVPEEASAAPSLGIAESLTTTGRGLVEGARGLLGGVEDRFQDLREQF